MSLLLLALLAASAAATCLPLRDTAGVHLAEELAALGISLTKFEQLNTDSTYPRLVLRQQDILRLQLASFDLTDPVLRDNFTFRKHLLLQPASTPYFPYSTLCFEDAAQGHLLFVRSAEFESFYRCSAHRLLDAQFLVHYLASLAGLFREYEGRGVVLANFDAYNFGCDPAHPAEARVSNLHIAFREGGEMYRPAPSAAVPMRCVAERRQTALSFLTAAEAYCFHVASRSSSLAFRAVRKVAQSVCVKAREQLSAMKGDATASPSIADLERALGLVTHRRVSPLARRTFSFPRRTPSKLRGLFNRLK